MTMRHIVLVRVRPDVSPQAVAEAFDALGALQGTMPGLLSFHAGPNTSPEGKDEGFNYGFVMDFADAATRDAYLVDPRHAAAAAGLRAIRAPEGVLVFDLEL
jgi:hypothetical protein